MVFSTKQEWLGQRTNTIPCAGTSKPGRILPRCTMSRSKEKCQLRWRHRTSNEPWVQHWRLTKRKPIGPVSQSPYFQLHFFIFCTIYSAQYRILRAQKKIWFVNHWFTKQRFRRKHILGCGQCRSHYRPALLESKRMPTKSLEEIRSSKIICWIDIGSQRAGSTEKNTVHLVIWYWTFYIIFHSL